MYTVVWAFEKVARCLNNLRLNVILKTPDAQNPIFQTFSNAHLKPKDTAQD